MYKNYTKFLCGLKRPMPKILLVMKLTTILLFATIMQVSATAFAQKVTLNQKNITLKQVFKAIKVQTGYDVFWQTNKLNEDDKIDVNFKNTPLNDVIQQCIDGKPLTCQIDDKTVIIKEKEASPKPVQKANEPPLAPPVTISGKVTDSVGTPLIGATIAIKGTKTAVITDDKGEFQIKANQGDVLLISFIGYKPQEISLSISASNVVITLKPSVSGLKEVVVSNGYQKISAERATGAYDQIDNEMLNRSTGSNIIDRLAGIASGVQPLFGGGTPPPSDIIGANPSTGNGLLLRGVATISGNVSTSPLVVLDNFPYEGNINNINPNDIESVTLLKDAAAASIWGAQAGNGVIVITTKQGKLRQKMQVEFNANATILSKPNLFKNPDILNASDYINVETYLFNQGYYDNALADNVNNPAYTPIVGILAQQRAGTLSPTLANSQINAYRNLDNRSDIQKYFYQNGLNQQYSLGISGGSNDLSYRLGAGWDINKGTSVGSTFNRKTLNTSATYHPLKNLDVTINLKYTQYQNYLPPPVTTGPIYEMLADPNGNALPITYNYTTAYINSLTAKGYLDWNYYPLNELHNTSDIYTNKELLANFAVKYKITNFLDLQAQYQNEYQTGGEDRLENQQSYDVTNRINTFTQYSSTTGITNNYPLGALYTKRSTDYDINNYRIQADFNKSIGNSSITALLGSEIRKVSTDAFLNQFDGYNPQFGSFSNNLNFATSYLTTPSGGSILPSLGSAVEGVQLRYISYFSNLGYSYKDLYTFSLSGRKDGSNIFGVNTNDRFNLLWSLGGAWNINNETFYHANWLPQLKVRASYGFSGNVYNGSGYTTGIYEPATYPSLPDITGLTAPNPNLTWETVRTVNLGLDFGFQNRVIYGSIDIYKKDGLNLIEPIITANLTGFSSYNGNAANTKGKGLELNLKSDILKRQFKWTASLIANFNSDIITNYSPVPTTGFFYGYQPGIVGKPVYAIYSYKWAGLDPANGNPRGYLNGQVSEDYSGISNSFQPNNLIYNGSAVPTAYGSLINNFNYKKFTLSIMLGYEAGFYFRKPSTTGNYTDLLSTGNRDYSKAWQKPGDELTTYVPSFIYPSDPRRAAFYQYSQVLVQNGANIRLNDTRLDYDLSGLVRNSGFTNLHVFSYARIAKLLWTANKDHLDPDAQGKWVPNPLTISFGLQATLK